MMGCAIGCCAALAANPVIMYDTDQFSKCHIKIHENLDDLADLVFIPGKN